MIERVRRSDLLAVTLWFFFTRAVVAAAAFLGAAHPNPGYRQLSITGPVPPLLDPFVRWDASYYLDLARNGYPPAGVTPVYHAAFFPLYPMLIRACDSVLGSPVVTAMLLANVCALGAALLLRRLSGDRFAALLFLASPGAGFLSFPYSESLFCLLVAGSLLAVMRSRPVLAAALGALASASRPTGIVVALALLVRAWQERKHLSTALLWAGSALLSGAGLAAYALFCARQYGDPLYFAHLQREWGRQASLLGPLKAFAAFNFDPDYYLVSLVAIGGAFWMLRRARTVLSASAWFLLLVPLSTGSLKSMIRFQGANVPLIAGVGPHLKEKARAAIVAVSLLLLFYETFAYARGLAHN